MYNLYIPKTDRLLEGKMIAGSLLRNAKNISRNHIRKLTYEGSSLGRHNQTANILDEAKLMK